MVVRFFTQEFIHNYFGDKIEIQRIFKVEILNKHNTQIRHLS